MKMNAVGPYGSCNKAFYLDMIGGVFAPICYMNGNVVEVKEDETANIRRAKNVLAKGHHSVAEHIWISVIIEDIPKIMAMYLNSLGFYATSEKSSRYTEMKYYSEYDEKVFNKWLRNMCRIISNVYPNMAEKEVLKLARENASYQLSAYTETTMAYSAPMNMWCYIVDWCDKYIDNTKDITEKQNHIVFTISKYMKELSDCVKNTLDIPYEDIHDTKDRSFNFFNFGEYPEQPFQLIRPNDRVDANSYSTTYSASLRSIAQLQRHRLTNYSNCEMHKVILNDVFLYVPNMPDRYRSEWLEDLRNNPSKFTQARLFRVTESGTEQSLLMKAKERLCGRAQYETCVITDKVFTEFYSNPINKYKLKDIFVNGEIGPRCTMKDYKCTDPCYFGPVDGIDRSY